MRRLYIPGSLSALTLVLTTCTPTPPGTRLDIKNQPGFEDRCPVCGMFVAPHPRWLARVIREDGSVAFFDGAKDMFRYLAEPEKYLPAKGHLAIVDTQVTDYYTTQTIPARQAVFVVGSDVYGPMGAELVPHKTQADAEQFRRDHGAKAIVRFEEVTASLLATL